MDGAGDFAEAELGVEGDAVGVLEFGVAGEFDVAVRAGPIFDEFEESAADAVAAVRLSDEPAFEIRDGSDGGAFDVIAAN